VNHWSSSARKSALLICLPVIDSTLLACDAGGPKEPEPVQIPVQITAPDDLGLIDHLRVAVVWRQGTGTNRRWVSTSDSELTSLTGTTKVWFDLPPRAERSALADTTEAYVSCTSDGNPIALSAAIPRLVVYADRDQSGDFDPELPQVAGADRVLAVTPSANDYTFIAAFTDLDRTLSEVPMESAECIRSYTSGRYAAFFMAYDYSSYIWAEQEPLSAALVLSPTPYASVELGCSSYDVYSLTNQTSKSIESQSTLVDARLESDLCTAAPWQCAPVDITAFDIPKQTSPVIYPGYSQTFTCAVVGALDVLWSTTDSIQCTGCTCTWLETRQTWVTRASQAPDEWPCGETVKYCSTLAQSVWDPPTYCGTQVLARPE
jgi:hypothetical protein